MSVDPVDLKAERKKLSWRLVKACPGCVGPRMVEVNFRGCKSEHSWNNPRTVL